MPTLLTGELAACERAALATVRRWYGKNRAIIPDCLALDDLEQEARLGLLHASARFDPAHGTKMITYLVACALGHVQHVVRDRRFGGRRGTFQPVSLDDPAVNAEGKEGVSLVDRIASSDPGPESRALQALGADLLAMQKDLPPRLRQISEWYYIEGIRQWEIGERLGLSQMHVSRLLRKGDAIIRKRAYARLGMAFRLYAEQDGSSHV